MMIFQACTPPACRVSGITVLPSTRPGLSRSRGSPSGGAATRSSNATRYTCDSASSNSRVGRRRPVPQWRPDHRTIPEPEPSREPRR